MRTTVLVARISEPTTFREIGMRRTSRTSLSLKGCVSHAGHARQSTRVTHAADFAACGARNRRNLVSPMIGKWVSLLIVLVYAGTGVAIEPEPGIYWAGGDRSGEGLYLERQGKFVSVMIFAYSDDGSPVFYTAAGELVPGPVFEPTPFGGSAAPAHRVTGELFRYTNGPFFGSIERNPTGEGGTAPESVGTLVLEFVFHSSLSYMVFYSNAEEHGVESGQGVMERFTFGIPPIGEDLIVDGMGCFTNLEGVWAFTNPDSPGGEIMRFDFGAPQFTGPITCPGNQPRVVEYEDSVRNAVMRCVVDGGIDPVFERRVVAGCQVSVDDEPRLWFSDADIGLHRIVATVGEIPTNVPDEPRLLRGPDRLIGVRIEGAIAAGE